MDNPDPSVFKERWRSNDYPGREYT